VKRNRFRSFEDFAEALRTEPVPTPSAERVLARIAEARSSFPSRRPAAARFGLRTVAFAALAALGFAATALAAAHTWQLYNERGELVYEVRPLSADWVERDRQVETIRQKYFSEIGRLEDSLAPGESAAFLAVEAYELGGYVFDVRRAAEYAQPEQLMKDIGLTLPLPTALPDGVELRRAAAEFAVPGAADAAARAEEYRLLYEEAKAKGEPYAVRRYPPSGEFDLLRFEYGAEGGVDRVLQVNILPSRGGEASSWEEEHPSELVTIAGTEALYNEARNSLMFVANVGGRNLQYLLIGMAPQERWISKRELVAAAGSMLAP